VLTKLVKDVVRRLLQDLRILENRAQGGESGDGEGGGQGEGGRGEAGSSAIFGTGVHLCLLELGWVSVGGDECPVAIPGEGGGQGLLSP
jgi:hypothetical protein